MNKKLSFEFRYFIIVMAIVVAFLWSIRDGIRTTNKQLKHIVQMEQQQATTHKETTIQTTTPELIIEENTLGGSNAK